MTLVPGWPAATISGAADALILTLGQLLGSLSCAGFARLVEALLVVSTLSLMIGSYRL